MSKENTIISLLKEINKNIDNVGSVGNASKVKVNTFKVTNECINDDGIWEGGSLIDISNATDLSSIFNNCSQLQSIDVSNWDTSNVTKFMFGFYKCINLQSIDVSNWNTSKLTDITYLFEHTYKLTMIDTTKWNCSQLVSMGMGFARSGLISLIGNKTINDVLENNISCLSGLRVSVTNAFSSTPNIDRASLRALINGLADLTGSDAQTLTLGETLIAKLTEEDIAIATAKNWTIA